MSNIFHEIKRGFLVLGFTGPLSSGCTTAAKFFEKDINDFITKRFEKVLPKIEAKIRRQYKELEKQKDKLNDKIANKSKIYNEINKLSYQIKENLNLRETLTILNDYKNNNFKYISMTDMLLKLSLEYISDENGENLNAKILKLKNLLLTALRLLKQKKSMIR